MSSVSVCLIERNVFFREGLKSLLSDTGYNVERSYPDWHTAEKMLQETQGSQLFIISDDDRAQDIKTQAGIIKRAFPDCRIVVFFESANAKDVASLFAAGIDGCLFRSILPQALTGALDMIMAGEKICPPGILDMLAEEAVVEHKESIYPSDHNLSSREMQILGYLTGGDSNKQIARHLDITEATVKVHIKAVLRKLDLSNRTQAAVWAVHKGLNDSNQRNAA